MRDYIYDKIIINTDIEADNMPIEEIIGIVKDSFPRIEGEDNVYVFYDKATNGHVYFFDGMIQLKFYDVENEKLVASKVDNILRKLLGKSQKSSKIEMRQDFLIPITEKNLKSIKGFLDTIVNLEKLEKNNPFEHNLTIGSLEFALSGDLTQTTFKIKLIAKSDRENEKIGTFICLEVGQQVLTDSTEKTLEIVQNKLADYCKKYIDFINKSILSG